MAGFPMQRYVRASQRLDLEGIDFERVPDHPLSSDEIRCLVYMMDIETHTVIYLRDLLATSAARDPDVTAFLSMWVYEEFWHGEALGKFLRAAGVEVETSRTAAIREASSRPLLGALKTLAAKTVPDFVALHMTWGAINEVSTLHGYQRVIARTRHPILRELLARIIKDERRHFAFYFGQARMRLHGRARTQRFVRWALGRFWAPVGAGVRPREETDFLIACLFGDEPGAAVVSEMEAELSKLPGLDGMRIMTRARNRAVERARPPPSYPLAANM